MKYRSINRLSDFEFHDSEWFLVDLSSSGFVVNVKLLNIHEDAPQNRKSCDMEIEVARITFDSFSLHSFCPSVVWKTNPDGSSQPTEPLQEYTGKEGIRLFLNEFGRTVTVFRFVPTEDNCWILSAAADDPYFEAAFSFGRVTIEWDAYRRPAWYVRKQRGLHN